VEKATRRVEVMARSFIFFGFGLVVCFSLIGFVGFWYLQKFEKIALGAIVGLRRVC
jgi:hypothetical protein